MKLYKLTLNNFYRYYGEQKIVFSTENDKNITVLRGENGTGKTTLLNAFYWVMYGDVIKPLTITNMLNHRTKEELEDNSCAYSSVTLEFEDRNKYYTVVRKQRFIKQNGYVKPDNTLQPYISYIDQRTGNEIEVSEKDFFESIIPKELRGFFFFDGERINKLAQIDGKKEIRQAILDILGLTTIDNTSKDLDSIRREYTKDLARLNSVNGEDLEDELESVELEISILEEAIEMHETNIKEYREELDKVEKYLQECNSSVINEKVSRRRNLENSLQRAKNDLVETKNIMSNHIAKNLKLEIISRYFNDIESYLENKREKGELPSDIKIQFIDDLIERKKCICGCSLEEGSEHYKLVMALKNVAGRSELDDAYTKITSFIKQVKREEDFYEKLNRLTLKESNILDSIDEYNKEMNDISKEIQSSDQEKIRYNEKRRLELNNNINDRTRKIGMAQSQLRVNKSNQKRIEEKIKKVSINNNVTNRINKQIKQTESLLALNNEIKEYFVETTRVELDKKIKEVFSKISRKDYRTPVLTKDFELKIVNNINDKLSKRSEVLSTGEGQITSLSFIGSLVEYAREKIKEEILSDFSGGDFPLVMDSPFGNLDETHTANVAANIGVLASQVIIIVSDKQWRKEVEDNMKSKVGKMYKIYDENDRNKKVSETTMIKEEVYVG